MAKWYIIQGISDKLTLATQGEVELFKNRRKILYEFEADGLLEAKEVLKEKVNKISDIIEKEVD